MQYSAVGVRGYRQADVAQLIVEHGTTVLRALMKEKIILPLLKKFFYMSFW